MTTPVDWDEMYPGRFLKPFHVATKPTLTIASVDVEELVGDKGPVTKGILGFSELEFKALPLNKTNGICLREMFGRKLADWIGKRVVFFESQFNGEPCIRVWGSPELQKDTQIIVQLPRKKPITMLMHATGGAGFEAHHAALSSCLDLGALRKIGENIAKDDALTEADKNELRALAKSKAAELSRQPAAAVQ